MNAPTSFHPYESSHHMSPQSTADRTFALTTEQIAAFATAAMESAVRFVAADGIRAGECALVMQQLASLCEARLAEGRPSAFDQLVESFQSDRTNAAIWCRFVNAVLGHLSQEDRRTSPGSVIAFDGDVTSAAFEVLGGAQ
jgi:hypothetical protein